VPDLLSCNRFPPGEGVDSSCPGDFILVRGTSWRNKVTSAYQWGRARGPRERQCACWNHTALVVGNNGAIVEAGTAGVVQQHLNKYRDEDYIYAAVRATLAQRLQAVRFAVGRMGSPYDNLALAGIVLSALTRGRLRLSESQLDLCGSLVARALAHCGERFARHPSAMTPADLALHYGVGGPTASLASGDGYELGGALDTDEVGVHDEVVVGR
jgi:hypothetical protein